MPKESIAEIPKGSGNCYRYAYEGGRTVYKGPVGEAPEINEEEFNKMVSTQTKVIERWDTETYSDKVKKWDFKVKEEINNERTFQDWETDMEVTIEADYILWDPEQDVEDESGSNIFIYGTITEEDGQVRKGRVGLLTMHSIREGEYPVAESILFDDWSNFAPVVIQD